MRGLACALPEKSQYFEEAEMTQTHKRHGERFITPLRVILEHATGVTRDASTSGAFFWTSGTYTPGQPISFAIELKTAVGMMMWRCRGAVVRTELRNHMVGVAATITESTLEPANALSHT